jgi:hypothetical protein
MIEGVVEAFTQGRRDMGPEPNRVVVGPVDTHPSRGAVIVGQCLSQQSGLPISRRRRHDPDRSRRRQQLVSQAGAIDRALSR